MAKEKENRDVVQVFFQYFSGKKRAMITQSIGRNTASLRIHTAFVGLDPGDELYAVGDGVTDNLSEREMGEMAKDREDAGSFSSRLVSAAKKRSEELGHLRAKKDDITVVGLGVVDAAETPVVAVA
jgi:serine/threonine protein phosphatase PrpC